LVAGLPGALLRDGLPERFAVHGRMVHLIEDLAGDWGRRSWLRMSGIEGLVERRSLPLRARGCGFAGGGCERAGVSGAD